MNADEAFDAFYALPPRHMVAQTESDAQVQLDTNAQFSNGQLNECVNYPENRGCDEFLDNFCGLATEHPIC